MAAANLDTNKLTGELNDIKAVTLTALDATDGGEYTVTKGDERTVLVIVNTDGTNAENVVIKAPAHPVLGVGTGFPDKTVSVAKSATAVCYVESMRYMDAATGKVTIKGSADVKVGVIQM
jgi:hypothetical protein